MKKPVVVIGLLICVLLFSGCTPITEFTSTISKEQGKIEIYIIYSDNTQMMNNSQMNADVMEVVFNNANKVGNITSMYHSDQIKRKYNITEFPTILAFDTEGLVLKTTDADKLAAILDDGERTESSTQDLYPSALEVSLNRADHEMLILEGGQIMIDDRIELDDHQFFMVTTLNGTTKVEFVYIPSSSGDIKSAFIYDGYETNEAHFRIDFDQLETTLGHGYFLVYKKDIAVRTKSFTFIKAE